MAAQLRPHAAVSRSVAASVAYTPSPRASSSLERPFLPFRSQYTVRGSWRRSAQGDDKEKVSIEDLKEALLEDKTPKEEQLIGEGKGKKEDQTIAIVTGAVSVLIGVLYLAGVTFLNSRGNTLLPPPPEAFGWISSNAVQSLL